MVTKNIFDPVVDKVNELDATISADLETTETGITAYAGKGQANATQLTAKYNKVTVVASDGDSVKLKQALAGAVQIIVNADSGNYCTVYPYFGDNFEGLSANASTNLGYGASYEFVCFTDGEWTGL